MCRKNIQPLMFYRFRGQLAVIWGHVKTGQSLPLIYSSGRSITPSYYLQICTLQKKSTLEFACPDSTG